ncbi:hypothetical protein COCVIDRAFT_113617 [Bipolaris victoriae FI3]|uniref:DUF4219 domain-containing protein n=1 Tax=Bipolaris victoriae (strain FI3) TaxID=930091 RepID=W7DU35_BIPV3|nr:hypothetical protein COCVIDRAFT_113617 [Bipolaris victoriae FI3]
MSNHATRDATVILTDSNNWTSWYRQLKIKCESLKIWALVDRYIKLDLIARLILTSTLYNSTLT